MTVHIGEITSEVSTEDAGSPGPSTAPDPWEERATLAAALLRLERDRLRTATGYGDD